MTQASPEPNGVPPAKTRRARAETSGRRSGAQIDSDSEKGDHRSRSPIPAAEVDAENEGDNTKMG